MPYVIQSGSSDSRSVSRSFEPEIDRRVQARIAMSCPLSDEEVATLPRKLLVGRPQVGGVPHIICWSVGPFIVSRRVRDIIEELEPGVQEFAPVVVSSKDNRKIQGKTVHGMYYMILRPPELDAIVVEKTDFEDGHGCAGIEGRTRANLDLRRDKHRVLESQVVAGHHFWRACEPLKNALLLLRRIARPSRQRKTRRLDICRALHFRHW